MPQILHITLDVATRPLQAIAHCILAKQLYICCKIFHNFMIVITQLFTCIYLSDLLYLLFKNNFSRLKGEIFRPLGTNFYILSSFSPKTFCGF